MSVTSAKVIRPPSGMDQIVLTHDVRDACAPGAWFTSLGWAPRGEGPKYIVEVLRVPLDEVIVL